MPVADVENLLSSPFLERWFTTNYDGHPSDKLIPIPLGFDFHTGTLPKGTPPSAGRAATFLAIFSLLKGITYGHVCSLHRK